MNRHYTSIVIHDTAGTEPNPLVENSTTIPLHVLQLLCLIVGVLVDLEGVC
jgi:hypothetical protein